MASKITGPKGAPDLLPPKSALYDRIIEAAVRRFRLYGYRRIDTPVFEATELFERGLDQASEIVTKQMYTFTDRGGRSLTLRPDMTAPVVRAVLEHGLDRQGLPVKLYYVAPIFRQERPQAGRQRQFTQVGVEAVGSPAPELDAEVVKLAADVYRDQELSTTLSLNSVGHPGYRAQYIPVLQEFLRERADRLCEDCRRKIETNPLRTFDCKVETDRAIMKEAPYITDHLCEPCRDHHDSVKQLLKELGVDFEEDPTLVRGLDYYTRTAFEFVASGLGSQDAVGGGGRYDGLAEQLGGPSLPGIGFGLGVERIALALASAGAEPEPLLDVFVASVGDRGRRQAFKVASMLRDAGMSADLDFAGRVLGGQFKAANRAGAEWVIVIGDKELDAGRYTVRRMSSGEESSVPQDELVGFLEKS
ncbi:MAG TPA: histidine--tRNA ligase [Actinomycetota bacterium]|nr:histidine--tRNA ligase [Actinomycetota bacterium]